MEDCGEGIATQTIDDPEVGVCLRHRPLNSHENMNMRNYTFPFEDAHVRSSKSRMPLVQDNSQVPRALAVLPRFSDALTQIGWPPSPHETIRAPMHKSLWLTRTVLAS